MPFPLMFRADHDAMVKELRDRITGLAKVLYPSGVPKEFQLLVGIEIPDADVTAPVSAPESKPSPAQLAEEEEAERQRDIAAKLRSLMRTSPSKVGPYMEGMMRQTTILRSRAAHPAVGKMFTQAESEVLDKKA